ncbi:MAG: hypothetical protein FJX31_10645 [Alphaproteobacteria bacterium]|nr:hypothetical protein [Alphaproteobacteria bacterium]
MNSGWALRAADAGPLTVVLVALAPLVLALVVHNWPGRQRSAVVDDRIAAPSLASGRNDLAVSLPEVHARMTAAAGRMVLLEHFLPRLAMPGGGDGNFVFRDKFEFVYGGYERGSRIFEHCTVDMDDLLYRVFRDRAWTRTYLSLIGQDLSEQDHAARLAKGQLALLEKADPCWAERLRAGRN